jgi:uncharacterized protein with HEPN domain
MLPEIFKYLDDIVFSLSRIEYHLKDVHSYEIFKNAWTVYDAVERRLAIIGEAVLQIDKLDKDFALTDKKKIIGFRHILTHDYDIVSADIIWKIIDRNLTILKSEVTEYLKNKE